MIYLWLAVLFLLIGGALLLRQGRARWQETGLPDGEVVYSDTGQWEKQEQPLISRRYGIVGRPDYLVRIVENGQTHSIPVEVKSHRRPAEPYASHILQLATYCLLVEDVLKARPPYGFIRYADATLRIAYSDELRVQVLEAAEGIRSARGAPDVKRDHREATRCRNCGYRRACGGEALP
ncbi:MAG: Dna2/Cas4 domain-containing protein [Caldilineaceae bacterium]|nr:Dna2/Cas4 domain-containing protein [Caldilineaceae bacterium]HRJ40516.1 Dna2/Cas4 domain-containing protein [Caldilineaceae bacterium]